MASAKGTRQSDVQWKPNVTVTVAAVVKRGDRFLLVEEKDDSAKVLNQPAGHVEAQEGIIAAVRREVLEETGWEFTPRALVGMYHWHNAGNATTYLRFCFAGDVGNHDPDLPLDAGIIRALWLTRAEVEGQKDRLRSPMVLRCIQDFESGQSFPLHLLRQL